MSVHTRGPWAVNDVLEGGGGFGEWRVESEHEHGEVNDGWCIASMQGPDGQANAYLIAAAPDLLAILKTVAGHIHSDVCSEECCDDCIESQREIARAEGRS